MIEVILTVLGLWIFVTAVIILCIRSELKMSENLRIDNLLDLANLLTTDPKITIVRDGKDFTFTIYESGELEDKISSIGELYQYTHRKAGNLKFKAEKNK